jgi:hypothetical protein
MTARLGIVAAKSRERPRVERLAQHRRPEVGSGSDGVKAVSCQLREA